MAILLLTDANLRALKSVLMSDFEMSSSHSSEGIAALIGFKSHSAYLSSAMHGSTNYVAEVDFDAFERRCAELGYDRQSSEWLRYCWRSIPLDTQPWKIIRKGDSAAYERWYAECQRKGTPFIVIEKARTRCKLSWDCAHIGSESFASFRHYEGEDRGRLMYRLFCLIADCDTSGPKFDGSWHVGDIKNLREPTARQIANEFARLLSHANVHLKEQMAA